MMQRREFLSHMARATLAGSAALVTRRGAWAAAEVPAGTARRASVVDFGADPTGEKDSTAAVRKAVAALARRNARLVFPAGKYTFAGSNDALMRFNQYEGLEIFGNGAELSFSGDTQPLRLLNCKDLEIHDMVIDWVRPAFSQGRVSALGDRSVTIAVDPAYPVDGSERVQALLGFDASGKAPLATGMNLRGVRAVQLRGAQTLEVALADRPPYQTGMHVALLHPSSAAAAIQLDGCEQILLETVVVHSSVGAAVLLSGCHDVSFDTFRVIPHPGSGRWLSSGGGGVELLDCTGAIATQHMILQSTAGAGLRIQQSYWRIAAIPDPQVAFAASVDGRPVLPGLLPKQGSYLQLSEPGSLKLLGEIAVTRAEPAPGGMKLSFEETLSPSVGKGTLVCLGATNQPNLKIDDCKFLGGPGVGIVAQSRLRVNSSSFSAYAGPAILLAPDAERLRGPVVENIHVTECNFSACSTAADTRGAITVDTQVERRAANPSSRINDGITIQRNLFNKIGAPAIYCAGASWVDIESNHFNDCDDRHRPGVVPTAVVLKNCDETTITLNDTRGNAQIAAAGCTDKLRISDNGIMTTAKS